MNYSFFQNKFTKSAGTHGPHGHPLFGVIQDMQHDPMQFLLQCAQKYPGICKLRFLHKLAFLVDDAEAISQIALGNRKNYIRSPLYNVGQDVVGEGLFTADDSKWRRKRRNAQPAFQPKKIERMLPTISDLSKKFVDEMKTKNTAVDLSPTVSVLMQNIVVSVLFGSTVGFDNRGMSQAWRLINDEILKRWWDMSSFTQGKLRRKNPAYDDALKNLNHFVYDVIKEKRASSLEGSDLLTTLIQVKDEETGTTLSDKEIRDELITFFFAGSDTTAMTLCWALYLIDTHSHVKQQLQEEIDSLDVEEGFTLQTFSRLPYMKMVVDETLRLYPPVWSLSRLSVQDDTFKEVCIPANSMVFVSPYVTHRNSKYWPNPEQFNPERFVRKEDLTPFSYFPFGFGERTCIGAALGTYEVMISLFHIMKNLNFEVKDPASVKKWGQITLQPQNLFVHFEERTSTNSQKRVIQ